MRKALIAAIVAAALFAVGAFAAEFTLNADDVASGEAPVDACATEANVAWSTTTEVGTDGEFKATGATITFEQVTATTSEPDNGSCAGQEATIAIGLDTDDVGEGDIEQYVDFDCTDIASGVATCSFESNNIVVSQIEAVSVLAGGTRID